jgi:hypothetical protein
MAAVAILVSRRKAITQPATARQHPAGDRCAGPAKLSCPGCQRHAAADLTRQGNAVIGETIMSAPSLAPAANDAAPIDTAALPAVTAAVRHVVYTGEKPAIFIVPAGAGESRRAATYVNRDVAIHDARAVADRLTLDREGLALLPHDTKVADFYDEAQIADVYYPEMVALLQAATGAEQVVVFDHTRRADGLKGPERGVRPPVRSVHNDYTEKSGPQRVRDLLPPDEAERWLSAGRRFAFINVWRPINGTVETAPLAVADATSVPYEDFIATDLVYSDRTGEIFDVAYRPGHRWYYVSHQRQDEVMLIKCYDSARDGTARFTAHTAFDDPTAPPGAKPRESIEIRTMVLYPEA